MKSFLLSMVAVVGLVSGLATDGVAKESKSRGKSKSIVELAAGDPNFSTLVVALQAADLVDTLSGPGPFTIFAPTNEAFEKLPEGRLEELLKPKNKKKLTELLTCHVIPGKLLAAEVVKLDRAQTVEGHEAKIAASKRSVKIDGARVIETDLLAKNGVIHVIDAVILPGKE